MSHDTHNAHSSDNKTILSFRNSFWLVIILVGLFIAALNFIKAESGNEEEGKGEAKEKTEMPAASEKAGEQEKKAEEPKQADTTVKDTTAQSK
jgi:hypothetical protein